MSITKKQKQQTAAAAAAALLLWLLMRKADAKPAPTGIVTVGPVTTQVSTATPEDNLRDNRAALASELLDIIAWNEDTNEPTRRPTAADDTRLAAILKQIDALGRQIPDPDGFDAERAVDLTNLVLGARAQPAATSSRQPKAFGSSRFITRRIEIERAIRDAVAMDAQRKVHRRPSDGELPVLRGLMLEYAQLGEKLLSIDESFDEEIAAGEPLDEIMTVALNLDPRTTGTIAARSNFEPGIQLA